MDYQLKKKAFKCDECNIERATKKTLNNHKETKHKGSTKELEVKISRFKCENCGIEAPSSKMLRNHLHEVHIGIKQLAGAKRTTNGNIKSNEMEDTSPLKKKKKNISQDLVDDIEPMDDIDLSTTLGKFEFSVELNNDKDIVSAKSLPESEIQELSRKQDEKVLTKRRLEEEEEVKESKRREDEKEKETNKKKNYSSRRKKVAKRKKN